MSKPLRRHRRVPSRLLLLVIAVLACVAFHPARSLAADAPPRIKIGVLALHFEERAMGPTGSSRLTILRHYPASAFDVRPITDPDAEADALATEIVGREFHDTQPIDGGSADALASLDVIIAPREWVIRPEILANIHKAVSGGVGLLNQTPIAWHSPGLNDPKVLDLHGMTRAAYFYYASTRGPVTCTRLADHPLLDGVKGNDVVIQGLNGLIGDFKGTALIAAPELTDTYNRDALTPTKIADGPNPITTQPAAVAVFYPFYVAQFGKGRIVGCQWYKADPPGVLARTTPDPFYVRCVKWLAEGKALAVKSP